MLEGAISAFFFMFLGLFGGSEGLNSILGILGSLVVLVPFNPAISWGPTIPYFFRVLILEEDFCMYVKQSYKSFGLLPLYVHAILLAENDNGMVVDTKECCKL